MTLLANILFIGLVGWGLAQPILPVSYQAYQPYQLVYLTPPQQQQQQHIQYRPPQQILHNRVAPQPERDDFDEGPEESDEEQENYEVSQFHSEDEHGRVVYGFHSPDQIRMEARDADGTVRGSYSYIDANGNIVKMHYWDDGSGFHAAGNNLPIAVHQEPEYTPEVKAAREQHFRLYEAALASLQAAVAKKSVHQGPEYTPEVKAAREQHFKLYEAAMASLKSTASKIDQNTQEEDNPDYAEQPNYSDADPELDNPSEDTVIIENGVIQDEKPEYPKMPFPKPVQFFQDQQLDDDKESVAIENPEFRSNVPQWVRKGKSSKKMESQVERKEPEVGETIMQTQQIAMPQKPHIIEKKIDLQPLVTGTYNPITKEITGGNRAFYYHFQHVIPIVPPQIQQAQASESKISVSSRAKELGGIPVAAVHDSQVSPTQREAMANVQVYPVFDHEAKLTKKN